MKGIREIKGRIRSVRSTSQITRAMQLVAASKMKRAQDAALAGRPYSLLLAEILNELTEQIETIQHAFLKKREVKKRCMLVVSTDRGLCGALNQNVFRQIDTKDSSICYVSVGKKATQFLGRNHCEILGEFQVEDAVTFHEVRKLVRFLVDRFESGEIDTVEALFPRYKNTLVQEPTVRKLLPIVDFRKELEKLYKRMGIDVTSIPKDERYMIFEPGPKAILEQLPLLFIKQSIFQILMEAKASEHSARMVAMKTATDNAESLIDDLTLEYNKARQAAITQEILEIAASQQSQGR